VELLAIVIALGIYMLRGSVEALQPDAWLDGLRGWLGGFCSGALLQVVTLLLPAMLVLLLQRGVEGDLYGLPSLLVLVFALLYSFGRGNLGAAVCEYVERWSRGDFQAAFEQLQQNTPDAVESVEDPALLHAQTRRRLHYRAYERVFAVLFWFVLLGPAGAVLYRLAAVEAEFARSGSDAAGGRLPLLQWLDWVPARLLGICFGLVGDFDATLYRWQAALNDPRREAIVVLDECGGAALRLADPVSESTEALIARGATELELVEVLYRRALLVWLVLIALLTLIG